MNYFREDTENIDIDTFNEDLDKIIISGQAISNEITQIISFDPTFHQKDKSQFSDDIKSVLDEYTTFR